MARRLPPVGALHHPAPVVLVLTGLSARDGRDEELLGPPVNTPSAPPAPEPGGRGVRRRCGVEVGALRRREPEKGSTRGHSAPARPAGRPRCSPVLPRLLTACVGEDDALGRGRVPVRPVHGSWPPRRRRGAVLPLRRAAGDTTGHATLSPSRSGGWRAPRFAAARGWSSRSPSAERLLADAGVGGGGGRPRHRRAFLDKLAAICEIPGVLEGAFDPRFLALPRSAHRGLRDHQSALTVEREGAAALSPGRQSPGRSGGAVRAGTSGGRGTARRRRLFARRMPRPRSPGERAPPSLAFHERLGSGKCGEERAPERRRIARRPRLDGGTAGRPRRWRGCSRPTSPMVGELTDLQGVVGGI